VRIVTGYLSVCSGIEAASVAWGPLGWKAVGFAEIDAFPSAVLAHRFPDVPNFGDFTLIRDCPDFGEIARSTDVLIGGTPCQAFSVAGKRGGMADARGNLSLEFIRLADAIDAVRSSAGLRPLIIAWENVPGVFTVSDNAFGCFVGAMVGHDAPIVFGHRKRWTNAGMAAGPKRKAAWRVLDAQHFGLAQRRERVFVVASAGALDPGEILFERRGRGGNPAPRGEEATVVAAITACGAGGGGGPDFRDAAAGHLITVPIPFGGGNCSGPVSVAPCLTAHGGRDDFDTETFAVCGALTCGDRGISIDQAAAGHIVPVVYRTSGNSGAWDTGSVAAALTTGTDPNDQVVAFTIHGRDGGSTPEVTGDGSVCPALRSASGGSTNALIAGKMGVRRLTPTEKEALQGFPRGCTCVPVVKYGKFRWRQIDDDEVDYLRSQGAEVKRRGATWWTSAAADGRRGKAIGNSMAVPVIRWIGQRIEGVMR
jgi:DNA (cytosine-5)-methyltransferase 1